MFLAHNTLDGSIRIRSIELLNQHLAAGIDLYGQIKHAHWNVRGAGFYAIHDLFDKIALKVDGFVDLLAERAGALGGVAQGTVQMAASRSFLVPYTIGVADQQEHCFAVSAALGAYGQSICKANAFVLSYGDTDTADLLTEISRDLDRQLWLVESHFVPQ